MKKHFLITLLVFLVAGLVFAEEDIESVLQRAKSGTDSEAMVDAGIYYLTFEKDYKKSVSYFNKAKKLSNPDACHMLGKCYQYGIGVRKNIKKAVENYKISAEAGNQNSAYEVGMIYYSGLNIEQNVDIAAKYFLQAAEGGNADGQTQIAYLYSIGEGVEKSEEKSFYWNQKAAEQKNIRGILSLALEELAEPYFNPIDSVYLLKYVLENSDEQGYLGIAYGYLGRCYRYGHGVEKKHGTGRNLREKSC